VQHTYADAFEVSGDGSHAITYWSTDAAGNAEAAHSGWVNIWASTPVTSANAAVSDSADGGWQTSDPQPVTLAATGGHGTATIHYQVDGDDQVDVEGADADFAVTGDGSHRITYWSTDGLGNTEAQHTGYVNIDTAAPVTDNTYAGGSAWQTGPASFSLTPTDSGSGMTGGSAGTTYQIDDGALQSGTDVIVEGDGEHTVMYSSIDNAGNVESVKTVTVRIDAAAPVTGDDAPTAWQNADTSVTLAPTDLLSGMEGGLAGTAFELDGGATEAGTSVHVAAPANHANDGAHVITYRSTDAVGNRETDKIATVLIDTSPPVTRDDIAAGPPAHTDPITVTLSPSDDNGARDVSGVAATHYRVDDGAWQTGSSVEVTGDGQHTVSYYSTDNAGNDEAVKTSQTLTIGTIPPGASTDDAPAGWVNHDVTLTITPGERAVRTTYELDGGPTQTGTSVVVEAPATHANDGEHVVTYRSSTIGDVAEATRTAHVRIDTTAPQTSDNAPAGWQHGPVTLTLNAADASSGVASTTYAIDGGAQQQGTSVVVGGDSTHTVAYFSTDNAGNVEAAGSAAVRIDDSAPQVTCPQAGRWFKTRSVTARFTAIDAASGVHGIAYRLGQGPWKTGSSILINGLGRHVVSFRATDANGNVSAATSSVIGIDRGRPKFTRGLPSRGKRSGRLALRFRVTDPRPSCGGATVTKIVVTTKHGKKVATIAGAGRVVRTNATVKCQVTYKLKRGSYRFRVYVVDLAGNKQKKAIPGKLVVK
jgi:large repetitive protein